MGKVRRRRRAQLSSGSGRLSFREQVFDHALRQQMIESAEGSRDLAEAFSRERRLLQRLMPDARETLTRLSARYALGMLTNGAPDLQREKIAASGLESLFKEVVISGVYGIGKPRPEIFLHLTDRLGVAPGEAVMVGNSLERDIAGARNAGISLHLVEGCGLGRTCGRRT